MANYLVLFSLSKANKTTGTKLISNLKKVSTGAVTPVWFDSSYVGIPISSDSSATEIWKASVDGMKFDSDLKDVLVVELGRDWAARPGSTSANWLTAHLGPIRLKSIPAS